MAQLGNVLRFWHHIRLPDSFSGLERHMETESLKEQLSRANFYNLNFNGR